MPIAARQLLAAGVTSARDVAAPLEAATRVRARVRERIIDGPNLYVSGPALRKLAPAGTGDLAVGSRAAHPTSRAKVAAPRERGRRLPAARGPRAVDRRGARGRRLRGADPRPAGARVRASGRPTSCAAPPRSSTASSARSRAPARIPAEMMQAHHRPADAGGRAADGLDARDLGAAQPRVAEAKRRAARRPAQRCAQLPELVAADIRGSLAGLGAAAARDAGAAAPALCEKLRQLDEAKVLLLLGSGAGEPGHLHSRATWQEIDFWVRRLRPARRARDPRRDPRRRDRDGRRPRIRARSRRARSPTSSPCAATCCATPALLQSVDIVVKGGRRVR